MDGVMSNYTLYILERIFLPESIVRTTPRLLDDAGVISITPKSLL
jgi:hypothetical protein